MRNFLPNNTYSLKIAAPMLLLITWYGNWDKDPWGHQATAFASPHYGNPTCPKGMNLSSYKQQMRYYWASLYLLILLPAMFCFLHISQYPPKTTLHRSSDNQQILAKRKSNSLLFWHAPCLSFPGSFVMGSWHLLFCFCFSW